MTSDELFQRVIDRYSSVEELVEELGITELYTEEDLLEYNIESFIDDHRAIIRKNINKLDIH